MSEDIQALVIVSDTRRSFLIEKRVQGGSRVDDDGVGHSQAVGRARSEGSTRVADPVQYALVSMSCDGGAAGRGWVGVATEGMGGLEELAEGVDHEAYQGADYGAVDSDELEVSAYVEFYAG